MTQKKKLEDLQKRKEAHKKGVEIHYDYVCEADFSLYYAFFLYVCFVSSVLFLWID